MKTNFRCVPQHSWKPQLFTHFLVTLGFHLCQFIEGIFASENLLRPQQFKKKSFKMEPNYYFFWEQEEESITRLKKKYQKILRSEWQV